LAKHKTRSKGATKSDSIREILKQHPSAPLVEVQAELKKRGVKASDALINKIKYGRGRGKSAKRGRRAANGRSAVNKADAIRGAWAELGASARPRDVIASLALRGIKVTSAQVSMLRKTATRRRKAADKGGDAYSVPFNHLLAAKGLAQRLGGIAQAREAVANLAKLIES
jgi:hypothetical protein